jgi:acylphosphatase
MNKFFHVIFRGEVQGVGFRYTARQMAAKYGVVGWVYNAPDGAVEVEIEGEFGQVNEFLTELKEQFREEIEDVESKEMEYTGKYKEFQIKF